ncbi:1-acyl-sn-glycerol-3-phosphate acyltransferase [Chloracidobacterium validum]|uniref:1-acyl-sn-glycerol-3-phosphate acyltransferase n=1 Tax=Chloracidobacterium validum TaxID=2821543 RepID=A0ABX8B4F2_9BACT|nr:lysophospholipid acyltransferase family protein [Chloracidobacterium validum]QUW01856.1 1-acyl-sn-glycerol-3-phosphate acyltransferase [Chloracidobacterium validum]
MVRLIHSIVALALIVIYTIVMASLALLIAPFDRTGEYQHWCARTWCRLIAWTVGMRVTVTGLDQLPCHTPAVVLSNHQSLLDIPVLFAFLPFQFRILAKKELFRLPFLGWFLWRAGHIPVDRGNRNATPTMIRAAKSVLEARIPVVIFPEGTRNLQPAQVKAFKPGGFRLAQEAGVPLVPVTIYGTAAFLPAGSFILTPCPVNVTIHPPIPSDRPIESAMAEVTAVMNRQLEASAHLHRQSAPLATGARPGNELSRS